MREATRIDPYSSTFWQGFSLALERQGLELGARDAAVNAKLCDPARAADAGVQGPSTAAGETLGKTRLATSPGALSTLLGRAGATSEDAFDCDAGGAGLDCGWVVEELAASVDVLGAAEASESCASSDDPAEDAGAAGFSEDAGVVEEVSAFADSDVSF